MTVYKTTEIVGTSTTSVSDAVRGAVERASVTLQDLQWFEVKEIRGRINEANAPEYQVRVVIGFTLHAPEDALAVKEKRGGKEPTTRQTRSQAAQVAAKRGDRRRTDLARNFQKQKSK
ncbi:MAG TPA: dodecin [Candidatus Thermoplasmatota archaeon]|nr:dodecin [Candidatus Thermoplasmatota archaeon]